MPGATSKPQIPLAVFILIVAGFFATTLPQPAVLGNLPLRNLLLTELGVKETAMSGFFFAVGLPWYFKPFAGILTDAFPLFGSRRRTYIVLSCLLAALSWLAMGFVPHSYNTILLIGIVVNTFMVIASTVMGAYMVEAGQTYGATGRLAATRQFIQNVCTLINGPLGGFLASGAFAIATGSASILVALLIPFAWYYLRKEPEAQADTDKLAVASQQMRTIFTSKTLWGAAAFMFLLYVAPGFSTPLYFKQKNLLHFTDQMIGNLGTPAGACGILAAAAYGLLCKKLTLRPLLYIGVAGAAVGAIFFYFYSSYGAALAIESQNTFFFTLAELAVMDLALRATPKGCEGFGFSLLMSVRNLALFGTDILGSYLAEKQHWPFERLVALNAGSTAVVLLFIPLLPKALVTKSDSSTVPAEVVEVALDPMERQAEK
ncbi:MAG: MFS transporter [Armatimonadetes bacterium]|nr:MFS transporter [Armatimonadota bacterium]